MVLIAEIIGITVLMLVAYYGGVAVLYRWFNGPPKKGSDDVGPN